MVVLEEEEHMVTNQKATPVGERISRSQIGYYFIKAHL
jgi:hypothetical protein